MLLHSIVPESLIYGVPGYLSRGAEMSLAEETNKPFYEIEYQGDKILARKNASGEYIIERIISTRPGVFLDPQLQPGQRVPGRTKDIGKRLH